MFFKGFFKICKTAASIRIWKKVITRATPGRPLVINTLNLSNKSTMGSESTSTPKFNGTKKCSHISSYIIAFLFDGLLSVL